MILLVELSLGLTASVFICWSAKMCTSWCHPETCPWPQDVVLKCSMLMILASWCCRNVFDNLHGAVKVWKDLEGVLQWDVWILDGIGDNSCSSSVCVHVCVKLWMWIPIASNYCQNKQMTSVIHVKLKCQPHQWHSSLHSPTHPSAFQIFQAYSEPISPFTPTWSEWAQNSSPFWVHSKQNITELYIT